MIGNIGMILIFIGIIWLVKLTINNKPISYIKLTEKEKSFYFNDEGKYAISTVKGRFVTMLDEFRIIIAQNFKSNADLPIDKLKMTNRTYNKWHIGIEFLVFQIKESGSYRIGVENPEKLIVKEPRFASKGRIHDRIDINEIELAIEKYFPFYYRIFAVLLIVTGVIVILWQII